MKYEPSTNYLLIIKGLFRLVSWKVFFNFMPHNYIRNDVFKPLMFCQGKYQISTFGKVKSIYTISKCGVLRLTGTVLKTTVNYRGYEKAKLQWVENGVLTKKTMAVHRLIGQAFIPNPENKPEINHLDFDKLNNNVNNLEWATPKENMAHYYASQKFKERQKSCGRFSEDDVNYLRSMFNKIPVKELAKMYGEPYYVIYQIVTNQQYNYEKREIIKLGHCDTSKEIINIETGVKYRNVEQLCNEQGLNIKNIRRQVSGERYSSTPYRYVGRENEVKFKPVIIPKEKPPKKERPPRKVYIPHPPVFRKMIMYDINGNELQTFESSSKAAAFVNSKAETFRKAIKKSPNSFTKGYVFKYA